MTIQQYHFASPISACLTATLTVSARVLPCYQTLLKFLTSFFRNSFTPRSPKIDSFSISCGAGNFVNNSSCKRNSLFLQFGKKEKRLFFHIRW